MKTYWKKNWFIWPLSLPCFTIGGCICQVFALYLKLPWNCFAICVSENQLDVPYKELWLLCMLGAANTVLEQVLRMRFILHHVLTGLFNIGWWALSCICMAAFVHVVANPVPNALMDIEHAEDQNGVEIFNANQGDPLDVVNLGHENNQGRPCHLRMEDQNADDTIHAGKECTICKTPMRPDDLIWELPCNQSVKHAFHKVCIQQWFQNENTCPLCRRSF